MCGQPPLANHNARSLLSLPQDLYERYEIQANETIAIWKTDATKYATPLAIASLLLQIVARCVAGLLASRNTRAAPEIDGRFEAIRSTLDHRSWTWGHAGWLRTLVS